MVLRIIDHNPYRFLGVFANASKKDIERNKSKFNAFLRVNRPIPTQFLDFPHYLKHIDRGLETISKAEGDIAIPSGKLAHGMFWFVENHEQDSNCFKQLSDGDIESAIENWKKAGNISGLHNTMICLLITEHYREALLLANNIFDVHITSWKELFSLFSDVSKNEIVRIFLDSLYTEIPKVITGLNWNGLPSDWEIYIKQKTVTPIVERLNSIVAECQKSHADQPKLRYQDATRLLDIAQPLLKELETLLKSDNITLQSIEDKVYSEILNCCISSYNAVYDELNSGDETSYRQIAPICNELTDRININYISPNVAIRVSENKAIISEKCANIEKTIEEHLAFSDQICWFCGAHGETNTLSKPYSYTTSEPTAGGTLNTTYTKTVKIHICNDCQNELRERKSWKYCTALLMFTIFAVALILLVDWHRFDTFQWITSIGFIGFVSIMIGISFSNLARKIFDKKNIRTFKREFDDHPLVKYVKSQGYH